LVDSIGELDVGVLASCTPPPREYPVPALVTRWNEQADRLESQAQCKGANGVDGLRWLMAATTLRVCAAQLQRVLDTGSVES
jgi:hypothetical protein